MCKLFFPTTIAIWGLFNLPAQASICVEDWETLSDKESELILVSSTDVREDSKGYVAQFPGILEGHKLSQASASIVDESGQPSITIFLGVDLDGNSFEGRFWLSNNSMNRIVLSAMYGPCLTLKRTVEPHNKSFKLDAGDAGAS